MQAREKFYSEHMLPDTIRSILQQTVIDMGDAGFDYASGYGLIDANAAIMTLPS